MPIIWQEAMSIGDSGIDDEHKYLFCLINCVEQALKLNAQSDLLQAYVDQLIDYTRQHFNREEKIQLSIKYPHYIEHKAQHQEILSNLEALKRQLLDYHQQVEVTPVAVAALDEDEEIEVADYDPEASPPKADTPRVQLDEATIAEVTRLMRHWVLDHVLTTDMKMKRYLCRAPVKKT